MKKQDSSKKAKWLIPVVVVALLAVIGGAIFLAFGSGEEGAPQPQATEPTVVQTEEPQLYWNVDREVYAAKGYQGVSARTPRSDGLYYIRFAINAEQVDLPVLDKTLVDRIDMQDVMGLVLDEEGVVVDMRTVSECTGGLVAPVLFVKSIEGNTLVANTHGNFKGLDMTLQLNENTKIYDVGGEGLLIGMVGTIKADDEIVAVKDLEGNISHVFVKAYADPADIYWNLNRKYNSTTKMTTREASVTGVYEFELALNGEVVKVRTRDMAIANKMDSYAAKYMALTFDDDGYVIDSSQSNSACSVSGTFASWARVDEVDGNSFHAYNSKGVEFNGEITRYTLVIDVSAQGGYSGKIRQLRVGDQVHCMLDKRGRISHAFIVSSCLDENLYWNTERQYDSTNKVTKRIPDSEGYYWFTLATNGQQVRVRTKDRDMATKIDGYATRCFALTMDGQDILKFHYAEYVHGNNSPFGSWAYVDKLEDYKITVKKINTTTREITYSEGVLSKDVEIINGSNNYASHCGEYSTLQVGDQVHCLRDYKGEIRVVYIVKKPVDAYLYWNMDRMYNSETKETTRVPDADGWYHFRMARNDGKQVDLKTKDRTMASKIDAEASKLWALSVSNGIIYKRYDPASVRGLGGSTQGVSWVDVTKVTPYGFTAVKNQAGHQNDGKVYNRTFAWDYKVINVSNGYGAYLGELTDLRVGDRIHVLHNESLQAKYIFVVGMRNPEAAPTPEECPCTHAGVTWEPWDGTAPLTNTKYYYLTQDVVAPDEGFIIQHANVHLRLDGHTISSAGRCFYLKSGGQLRICDHTGSGKLVGQGVEGESGGVIRVYSEVGGPVVKLWNLDLSIQGSVVAKEGGIISSSAPVYLYNCTLRGGNVSGSGGCVNINPTGFLNAFNTTLVGGNAKNGGLMNVNNGGFYLENVTLADGQSQGVSDGMHINSDKQMEIHGLTLTNSDAKGGSGINFVKGNVGIAGNVQIVDNGKTNVVMGEGASFTDLGMDASSRIGVQSPEQVILQNASTDLSGCFVSYEPEDYIPAYDAEGKQVLFDCIIAPKAHENDHCICVTGEVGGDHSCQVLEDWTLITDDVFEDAIGTNGKSQGIKFKEDGNYYLTLDYAVNKRINIMPGQKINICLNGCDLTRSGGSLIFCAGELNITDCRGNGKMIGSASDNGGTIKLVSGGITRLFAGTITGQGQTASSGGGVLLVSNDQGEIVDTGISDNTKRPASNFYMYGGTIMDGVATRGGNVCIWHTANFYMYGGTISGGTATTGAGGNICMESSGKLQLLGGTVTGGTAMSGSSGVRVGKGQITLGNAVNLSGNAYSDLSLATGVKLNFSNYAPNTVTNIFMDSPGVFAETSVDMTAFFANADPDTEVVQKNGELKLLYKSTAQGHIHCVCGGCAEGKYAHECENVKFEAWEKTDSLPTAGYYYLTDDVELSTCHQLGANNNLTLCLNGYKITCKTNRVFWINKNSGSLTVTSCQEGGTLEGAGVSGESGGVIRSGNEIPVLNLYNLTMTRIDDAENRVTVTEGGLVICSGFLNMYGVTGTNGYANSTGGIHCAYTCKTVIVDSQISGCTSNKNGGGLSCVGSVSGNHVEATLIDSIVTGNTSVNGDVYLPGGNNDLFLGGKLVIGQLNMTGAGNLDILDEGLASDAAIGLRMTADGVLGHAMEDYSGCFLLEEGKKMVFDEAGKLLKVVSSNTHSHCICGGLGKIGDHTCSADVEWTPISDSVFTTRNGMYVFAEDGHYYLTADYPSPKRITVLPDQNISICLNGYTLSRASGSTIFYVGGHANICDCTGGGVLTGNYAGDGGSVKLVSAASMNLFGGTLTRGSNKGCPVIISNDKEGIATTTITAVDERPASTFKMYGGAITGATTASNLKVVHSANFYMYGGAITGGHSNTYGGNLTLSTIGTVQLLGGTIYGGTATGIGNDIYVSRGTVYAAASFLDKITLASGASVEEAES